MAALKRDRQPVRFAAAYAVNDSTISNVSNHILQEEKP
jgi:hypothetical protein